MGRSVDAFHDHLQRLVVVAVELREVEAFGSSFDEGVEIVGLLQIEIELPVVRVRGDELAADGSMDFAQHRLDLRQEIVCRVATQVLDAGLMQAEPVTQLIGCCTEGGVDVASRESMQRKRMDDP